MNILYILSEYPPNNGNGAIPQDSCPPSPQIYGNTASRPGLFTKNSRPPRRKLTPARGYHDSNVTSLVLSFLSSFPTRNIPN